MSDALLPFYENELWFIRQMGRQFAEANPKIAGRLRIDSSDGKSDDPHVARMIEAFAYLNARTRFKLEDDFPEITEAMLGVLYPHYLAPIPSMSIVELTLDRAQAELTAGYLIDRETGVETESIMGQPCRFRTCYPVKLWPFALKEASLKGKPFTTPAIPIAGEALAGIRMEFQCYSSEVGFKQMELDKLRFHLKGDTSLVHELYEELFNNVIGVAVASGPTDKEAVVLPPSCIKPVGFSREESLLEYKARSFPGYRLLTEYFAFPEKFMFVDIELPPAALKRLGPHMEVYLYLDKHKQELERSLDAEMLRLGCTPVVNLFRQRAEPIRLTHSLIEYRVVPDARRPKTHEIYSIENVVATSPENKQVDYQPFYSFKHGVDARQQRTFWHAARRQSSGKIGDEPDYGTEMFLQLVDLDFEPSVPLGWTIDIETICTNRDAPARIEFGGGRPHLQLSKAAPVSKVRALQPFSPTLRPKLKHGTRWRLISHLTLNHLSLADAAEGADGLREILSLYDYNDSAETRSLIEGLSSVKSRRVVGRVGGDVAAGLCRGLEVRLHFDEEKFTGSGVFLYASVLERFLALYATINSFTKVIATTNKRDGVLHRWPPRAGERTLL